MFLTPRRTYLPSIIYSPLQRGEVSDNFGNSPQIAAPRRSREIDQSTQRFYVGWFHVGWQRIGDQSDAVTQNAWFRCACAAISGEISILIQTGAESWGRFPVTRICRWESKYYYSYGEHCWVFLQICINFNTKWLFLTAKIVWIIGPTTKLVLQPVWKIWVLVFQLSFWMFLCLVFNRRAQ